MDKEYKTNFKSQVKKQQKSLALAIEDAVDDIVKDPKNSGEEKTGDLSGMFVHKFKFNKVLYLISYCFNTKTVTFFSFGIHENFYQDLKNYIKS